MNNKAQVQSLIVFFIIVIGVFLVGLILMKVVNTTLEPFSSSVGNVSAQAGKDVSFINTKFNQFWDSVLIAMLVLNCLILFISAFMVDIHPAWIFVYIIALVLLFLVGMPVITIFDNISATGQFDSQIANLPMSVFIINNFGVVLLGIAILSGILMYAKIKLGSGGGVSGSY